MRAYLYETVEDTKITVNAQNIQLAQGKDYVSLTWKDWEKVRERTGTMQEKVLELNEKIED